MPRPRNHKPRLPRFIPPQLATLEDSVPEGEGWLHEVKYDGYRLEGLVVPGNARLLTRTGLDWTDRYPKIAAALGSLPVESAIVDGEVVAFDAAGRSSFQLLQQGGNSPRLRFVVFDLLELDGTSLVGEPFGERRAALERILGRRRRGIVQPTQVIAKQGKAAFAAACKAKLEGIVSKRLDAGYASGRNRNWLKVKCTSRQELVVIGFTPPERSRIAIGSLLLGVYERSALRYAGRVGTGMSNLLLRQLLARLRPLERAKSPLTTIPRGLPKGVQWVSPRLVVEVEFTEWTADGLLRHPSLVGVREDKPSREVVAEVPRQGKRPPTS